MVETHCHSAQRTPRKLLAGNLLKARAPDDGGLGITGADGGSQQFRDSWIGLAKKITSCGSRPTPVPGGQFQPRDSLHSNEAISKGDLRKGLLP